MSNDTQIKSLENRILDARNIFSAIFGLESYVFDRGLLDSESPVELDVYGLKSEAKNDAISLKYMMILIRLADLMDVANDRVNYHLLRQNLKQLSSESRFHWISHLVTDKLELKTSYKINDQFKQERQKSEAEKGSDRIVKPIFETINFDLYLNFKQLTTDDKSLKCPHCNCELLEDDTMMLTIFSSNSNRMCNRTTCPISCKWMMKKHQWLLEELVALNDYLFSVNEFLFDTSIRFNIHCVDDMRLDPDMFDDIQSYLLKEEIKD